MSRKGFTLIELLTVMAIIALLLSIIVPSIRKAKAVAKRLVCGTNLHQIQIACAAYANDNRDYFPTRGDDYSGYPHAMINTDTHRSLDETFFQPYLSDMREKVLFCPGALYRYRNPETAEYDFTYITYQYFNYPEDSTRWRTQPMDASRQSMTRQTTPLWGCLTMGLDTDVDDTSGRPLTRLSHHVADPDQAARPDGMNGVFVSGDAVWKKWEQCRFYLELTTAESQVQHYYWPTNNP